MVATGAWRLLLWIVAAFGLLGSLVAALGYPEFDPPNPDLPLDKTAISFAVLPQPSCRLSRPRY